jgi:hypothetical protein
VKTKTKQTTIFSQTLKNTKPDKKKEEETFIKKDK